MNQTDHDNNEYDGPSKSQVKREMLAITDLGKQIIDLPFDKVKQLNLDEKLVEAIRICQKISRHGEGKRRQTMYVGKLLRQADTEAIRLQLDIWENGSREDTAKMHRLENLRDQLIESDEELTSLLNEYPEVDVQQLRSLIRSARKEQQQNSSLHEHQDPQKKNYRALFQFLKTLV